MESVHIHNRCHDARSDVEATVRVLAAQIRHYSSEHDDFLCTVAGLSDSGNTDRNCLDSSGIFYWHQGGTMFFGKYGGRKLWEVCENAPRYLHWMLGADFVDEINEMITAALSGGYPPDPNAINNKHSS